MDKTHTMKMRIDTGDHPPVKLRPYLTPIHKFLLLEEDIRDMLEAGMIVRS